MSALALAMRPKLSFAAVRTAFQADPIFAVIREHAAAMRAQSAHYDRIAELERSIPADRRTWSWSAAMQTPPVGCTDAPDHIAAQLAIGTAFDRRSDAFVALLTTAPRTLAGVAALLDHLGSDEYPDDAGDDKETILFGSLGSSDRRCGAAITAFPAHLAESIRALTV